MSWFFFFLKKTKPLDLISSSTDRFTDPVPPYQFSNASIITQVNEKNFLFGLGFIASGMTSRNSSRNSALLPQT